MKKKVESYISDALKSVREKLASPDAQGNKTVIYEEYDGYAASFGASVITAGLLPTVSFYTNVHKKEKDETKEAKKPRRYKMLLALAFMLKNNGHPDINLDSLTALLDYVNTDKNKKNKALKADILAASIALKLALRNFEHTKSSGS